MEREPLDFPPSSRPRRCQRRPSGWGQAIEHSPRTTLSTSTSVDPPIFKFICSVRPHVARVVPLAVECVGRKRPTRLLGALPVVIVRAYVVAKTSIAADFFWPRALVNIASALGFAISILVRWPQIGVIVGPIVGTRTTWRQDPLI